MTINQRIETMEYCLNKGQQQLVQLQNQMETCQDGLPDLQTLFDYYGSDEWFEHLDLDRQGDIPHHIPRGVLSEDAVYDLILDYRQLANQMRDLADQIDRLIDKEG